MMNLITDVAGVAVGNSHDPVVASGVTAIIFDAPAVASVAIHGGGPAVRDTGLLSPEATVEAIDAVVLAGGSAFGLDAAGGVMAQLAGIGRGFQVGTVRVPIVPGASVFDLAVGGAGWGAAPPWWDLGRRAAENAARTFALGSVGGGYGATTANLKGGLGSASAITAGGFTVGALVVVNAVGTVTIGDTAHFWAAADEINAEFGGLGSPAHVTAEALSPAIKGDASSRANTTVALIATDAVMTKAQLKHSAVMAHDGMARAIRPSHAPLDGDLVFAVATGRAGRTTDVRERADIGHLAAHCLARAIARAVYEATALPFPGALSAYRERFGR
jgi:D-aminopeptidase